MMGFQLFVNLHCIQILYVMTLDTCILTNTIHLATRFTEIEKNQMLHNKF